MRGRDSELKEKAPAATGAKRYIVSDGRKHSTYGYLSDMADPKKLVALLDSLTPQERHFYGFPPKRRGRPKGKQQPETLERIRDAAALKFLKYSQPKMVPLLYPKQHVPEAGRKAVSKLLSRFKDAIASAGKAMTRKQAERIAKSLPRDKN